MGGFTAEPAQLSAAAGALSAQAEACRAELGRLTASAEDLFARGWRGAAASAFADGWHRWQHGASVILGALERNGTALDRCAAAYAVAEHNSRAVVERSRP